MYLYDKRTLFLIPPALFHPLLPMNIRDRKEAPKPDTQFHKFPFISCRPMAAERGHVRWNPDLLREGKGGDLRSKYDPTLTEARQKRMGCGCPAQRAGQLWPLHHTEIQLKQLIGRPHAKTRHDVIV